MAGVAVVGAGVFGAWSALDWPRPGSGSRCSMPTARRTGAPSSSRSLAGDPRRLRRRCDLLAVGDRVDGADGPGFGASRAAGADHTGALFLGLPARRLRETSTRPCRRLASGRMAGPGRAGAPVPPVIGRVASGRRSSSGCAACSARSRGRAAVLLAASGTRRVVYATARVAPLDEMPAARCMTISRRVDRVGATSMCWLRAMAATLLPQAVGRPHSRHASGSALLRRPAGDDRYRATASLDRLRGCVRHSGPRGRGFKVGIDGHGPAIDPRHGRSRRHAELVARPPGTRPPLPGLAVAPLVEARVCQYQNTSSGDFIIDRHPAWSNVWIVGGGSGHGFKHGPAVGRYVAARMAGTGVQGAALRARGKTASRNARSSDASRGSEREAPAQFDAPRRLRRCRLTEERRRQDADVRAVVDAVEEIRHEQVHLEAPALITLAGPPRRGARTARSGPPPGPRWA